MYKSKIDSEDILFEHKAWLSRQFAIFGSLFETAVNSGLVPSQTQHPGYYMHEAGIEARNRRRSAKRSVIQVSEQDAIAYQSIMEGMLQVEFFGQRSWRPGCQSLEPLDQAKEIQGLRAIKWREMSVNHSSISISLFTSASVHFKRNKCSRMVRYMSLLISEEYFESGDFVNSLLTLNQLIPLFWNKNESWPEITYHLLKMAIKSAALSNNAPELVKLMKQFICDTLVPQQEREIMEINLEGLKHSIQPTFPDSWNIPNIQLDLSMLVKVNGIVSPSMDENLNVSDASDRLSFFIDSSIVKCRSSSGLELPSLLSNVPSSSASQKSSEEATKTTESQSVKVDGKNGTSQETALTVAPSQPAEIPSESLIAQTNLLYLELSVPKMAYSRTPIQLKYTLFNRTSTLLPLELSMGSSDNFMFSGNKQVK